MTQFHREDHESSGVQVTRVLVGTGQPRKVADLLFVSLGIHATCLALLK